MASGKHSCMFFSICPKQEESELWNFTLPVSGSLKARARVLLPELLPADSFIRQ